MTVDTQRRVNRSGRGEKGGEEATMGDWSILKPNKLEIPRRQQMSVLDLTQARDRSLSDT